MKRVGGPLCIQVKQSAARQSWHVDDSPPPRPRFPIAHKTGRYDDGGWITERSRNAEIFVFGWHDRTDQTADHRDPAQWQFFVVAEPDLPAQASISLAALVRTTDAVPHVALKARVEEAAKRFRST